MSEKPPDRAAAAPAEDVTLPRLSRVRFVLVEPQSAANVGATARALKNLGLRRLHLVAPACDPRSAEARRLARDAADLLDTTRIDPDLDRALDGTATVLATSRRTGRQRRPHWRLDRLASELPGLLRSGELAVVLGREAHGLSDTELDRATHLVHFPSSDAYPSFNLAQSALLVAYHLRLAAEVEVAPDAPEGDPPAEHAAREAMYAHLERALLTIGFLKPQTVEPMMRRIRRMLSRAALTADEIAILRGVARQTEWASARGGLSRPGEPRAAGPEDC